MLSPIESAKPSCHWFTGTPDPSISVYKPFVFTPNVQISHLTISPVPDPDPAKVLFLISDVLYILKNDFVTIFFWHRSYHGSRLLLIGPTSSTNFTKLQLARPTGKRSLQSYAQWKRDV